MVLAYAGIVTHGGGGRALAVHGSRVVLDIAGIANPMAARLLVSVVDDDESVRESLPDLLREFGFNAEAFASAEEFLASEFLDRTRCLLLDIAMPGMGGPALQQELIARRESIPIVFITAHADETIRQQLLQAGAVDVLYKPFTESALLDAVTAAVRRNGSRKKT